MLLRLPEIVQDVLVLATRFLQGIGQNWQLFKNSVGVDQLKELLRKIGYKL
jgi:hypothetical protein